MTGTPRPKILFLSPYLPRYDRNAGDLRMYRILEILSENHNIFFLAQGKTWEGHAEEARYLAALARLKVTTYVKDYSLVKLLLSHVFKAAIIEFYYIAEHYIPRIRILQPRCRAIVDTVDIHYRRAQTKYLVTKNPDDFSAAENIKKKELAVYKNADVILTASDEDADALNIDCPGLIIRTVPIIYDAAAIPQDYGSRNLLFVGGFSHGPNVDAVLYFSDQIFPSIRRSVPDCTFTIVGSDPPEEIKRLQSDSIQVTGFVSSLDSYFRNSCVSVAPLRYGAGMKGKVVEAMSKGLPVVTTSIGAQGIGLVHRRNAMICDSPSEYADSVVELIQNRDLYRKIRQNGLDHIRNTFGMEVVGKKINAMIKEIQSISPKPMGLREKLDIAGKFAKNILS